MNPKMVGLIAFDTFAKSFSIDEDKAREAVAAHNAIGINWSRWGKQHHVFMGGSRPCN